MGYVNGVIGVEEEEVLILVLVPPYIISAALSQNNLRMIHHVQQLLQESIQEILCLVDKYYLLLRIAYWYHL